MNDANQLSDIASRPFGARIKAYWRMTGPGYMQSAMTLGGGSVASCAAMGSLLGYELLWVQPLGMLLGFVLLAAVAKQTTHTEERPYGVFWRLLHPSLAIAWGASAFIATIIWHIPQYSLTANGVVALGEGIGLNLEPTSARIVIGIVALGLATWVVYLYNSGASGLKIYERAIKVLVWSIVAAFAVVVFATGIDWGRLFLGLTGISFIRDLTDGDGVTPLATAPIVGGIAAAVGINMVFLYPYSLLNKKWGKNHTELAYFDLITGMALPFILATGLMILAVANTIGPPEGEAASSTVRDIREIVPVLAPTLGNEFALLIIGLGMTAIGFSTIITHMLACGFIGCEMFNFQDNGRARWAFSLAPAIGVVGVVYPFPVPLAITASTLAAPLMPVAVLCFLLLLNKKSYMGAATPVGGMRLIWNGFLIAAIAVMSVNAYFALTSNWTSLQNYLNPPAESAQAEADPVEASELAVTLAHTAMGTEFEITVHARPGETDTAEVERIARLAFEAVDDIEARISSWKQDSQTTRINNRGATEAVPVSADVISLLLACQDINRRTGGAFDVTVGPLSRLYGLYDEEGRLPTQLELAEALEMVGMKWVDIDKREMTVELRMSGVQLDFGGIGKGFALDRAAEILKDHNVSAALLHGGKSTVYAIGAPPGRDGWTVDIRHPYNPESAIERVTLRDASVSTSGCYGEMPAAGEQSFCNIFDPRDGQPVTATLSASAICPTATESDALSTAFLVMGAEAVETFCRRHRETAAMLVPRPETGEPSPQWFGDTDSIHETGQL